MRKDAIDATWLILGGAGFVSLIMAIFHVPWALYQIRKPVYESVCNEGRMGDLALQLHSSENLTFEEDSDRLMAVRVASGTGSIPLSDIRVRHGRDLVDLGDHPSFVRLVSPLEQKDSLAAVIVRTNLTYCNVPEPWALFRKRPEPQVFPVYSRPEGVEVAEAG